MTEQTPADELLSWQRIRLGRLRETVFGPPETDAVTVVVYHFWDEARFDAQFEAVESAILETWFRCGKLKTCLVVNRITPLLEAFAQKHGDALSIRLNPALLPGNLPSMSIDCNANLHRYFDTESVLVIQNDGFPLRRGLKAFEGCYDYIGAPFVRQTRLNQALGFWPRFAVGNGGFSLRSKRICEQASYYWLKRYRWMPHDWRFVREDAFYCVLLPFLEPQYRRAFRFAPWDEALRFSYDQLFGPIENGLPFGFHGAGAFRYFRERGLLEGNELDVR